MKRPAAFSGRQTDGFTLIELMIVVAIVAVLAAIAYPAYTNSVIKGKRGQGRAALLDLMQQQERYLTQSGSYVQWTSTSGPVLVNGGTLSSIPFKTYSGDSSTSAAYTLYAKQCQSGSTSTALNECVVVYAVPTFNDPNVLSFQSTGQKGCYADPTLTTLSSTPSACW